MAKRSVTASLEVSFYTCVQVYKLVVRLPLGIHKEYLPAFDFQSQQFARLEEYYGSIFMMHVIPDKYGFQHNILKTKGCVQIRYTDFSPFGITKELLQVALCFWKDSESSLKHRKSPSPALIFKELSQFQDCFLAMPIPGLEPIVSAALGKIRGKQSILVLLEPNGTLFFRSSQALQSTPAKQLDWDFFSGSQCYYLRPGVNQFLRRLQRHPRIVLRFYSSMSELRCSEVIPMLSEDTEYFSAKYCGREENRPKMLSRIWKTGFAIRNGFGHCNTILVESDYLRCKFVKKGLLLVPPYDLHQLQHCPSKLPLQHVYEYLDEVLAQSNFDVGAYMSAHPFTTYS